MAFTLVIPDVSFLGHEWQELADSSGSPPSPKAAFGNAKAVRANGGLRVSLRTHTIGHNPSFERGAGISAKIL